MKNRLLIIIAAISMCIPGIIFGQTPPPLGTVSEFVIFTSNGALTHTGAGINSHITGDIGSEIGGNSGFGNVDGTMRAGDGVTATALADLNVMYLNLSTQGPLTAHVPLLGGETLPPGLYTIPVPATPSLNGVLTLDGGGNPNAYFFFKLGTDFSTGPASEVKLINGAKACNVFWLVEGTVDIAVGTQMRGNIIANNAAINIATGVTLEGRALSTNGAISVNTGLIATKPIGCGSPVLSGPAPPVLASVNCYAIFSANGPITDDFESIVTGDVGSNLGSTLGYDPLKVVGAIHASPDGSTNACATDVGPAYNYLNLLSNDIELLYPADFGSGLVLTPHTYIMNSAVTFTDTLFLNAEGNPNAIFVIKVNAAFSTATYSTVVLQNGAQAKNVFWKIDGAVIINDYSVLKGTIVSAEAITLKTGVEIEGRVLTSIGAINTFSTQVIIPAGTCGLSCIPASITTGPTDQTVCEGDSIGFSVTATGDGLTYQWRKGNVNLMNGPGISGATTPTLSINPAATLDAANDYNVVVIGTCGNDTSINVSLIVNPATVITLEPLNQIACEGDSTGFTVMATGDNLTYQWRKGNVALIDGGAISGATTDTLSIDPTDLSDQALDYNVIVSGTCGNDTSIIVSLTINPATIITLDPINQIVCEGDSIGFTVEATGDNLTYQWRKGNVDLIDGGAISGATTDTLSIDPTGLSDGALDYNVIVSGACGNDTSIFVSLTISPATVITLEPIDQTVCIGDSAGFTITAAGGNLTYQWRKGTTNLTDGGNVSGATSDTLSISPVSALDTAYNYNVIVTGTCGIDTSINVSLMVDSAAVIVVQPIDKTVCEGDSMYFSVVATGANLTYQWRKGTVDLVDGGNISGATSDTLRINPANIADVATDYNVVVTGGCSPVGSTSVNLNSAGDFGILAGVGISSTGFSVISDMDIGISPGVRAQITGFPPATVVNGAIYASDDIAPPGVAAMLAQAKLDLKNAYLFAEGATMPAPVTIAGDQGVSTLTPGIYKSTSTLLIQMGDLTLDAQGDPNATWIFQIASDFTTIGGAGGNVILAGGAQAKNITWQVGSSATIGNGTSFKGNILALSSITMNTGSTIEGKLLARNGSVVLSGANIINQPINSTPSGFSTLTSIDVKLTISPETLITLEPTDQTVCEGDSTGFTVTASGDNLTYQWRKGNVDLLDGGNISGATTNTLSIDPTDTLNTGLDYNVIVSGTCGNDTSIFVSLIVTPATVITLEPTNQMACLGDSIGFTVTASGDGLTYQWRKGNVDLIDGGAISGATTDILSINPTDASDEVLNYNVIVSGTCGNDTSIFVSFATSPVTAITLEPINQTVCSGDSVGFTVTATGGNLTYQWRKGNVDLIDGGAISGSTTDTLSIDPVSASDEALNYNVIVSGACKSDTSIFVSLTVNPTPIAIVLGNPSVCSGDSINLMATTVIGGSYAWTSTTGYASSTQNLSIPICTITDAGTYSLIVTANGCSSLPTSTTVDVNDCGTDFFIPEGFSPNGDGINDLFVIRGISNYPKNEFTIYNRWGNKVYDASSYQSTWSGNCTTGLTVGGDELPTGTYFYTLDLKDGSDVFKGTIYLNR